MEAWTSTAQLKAAPDTESVTENWSVHKRQELGGERTGLFHHWSIFNIEK